jgi:hypothetical protein
VTTSQTYVIASFAAFGIVLAGPGRSQAQPDSGSKVEKAYGEGLPRDRATLIFSDDQYPVWPLTPEQQRYAAIDGAPMKRQAVDLARRSLSTIGMPDTSAEVGCLAPVRTAGAWRARSRQALSVFPPSVRVNYWS